MSLLDTAILLSGRDPHAEYERQSEWWLIQAQGLAESGGADQLVDDCLKRAEDYRARATNALVRLADAEGTDVRP